ncbi:hypothetical protein EJB05_38657, partial [Eragrostis curvula]
MALRLAVQALSATSLSPADAASPNKPPSVGQQQRQRPEPATATSRRRLVTIAMASAALLAPQLLLPPAAARGAGAFDGALDLRIIIPEESSEEAQAVVRTHARNLLRVKRLIDAGAWRELQAELRASASNLKQDLYAIIQATDPTRRAELRRLYSDLFNSVTSLDYAARDKDVPQVQEHYGNIVTALDQIFSKIT